MKNIKLWEIEQLDIAAWRRAKKDFRLKLMDLDDGASLSMLCGIIAGRREGPIITIVAGQHGDEWNGTYICHQIFNQLEPQDLKQGTLVIVPVANPWAFLERDRVSGVDAVDMNRSYLSTTSRKPTEYIASLLFQKIYSQSDYLIDIHTGGPGEYLLNVGITEQGRVKLATLLNTGHVVITQKEFGSLIYACERAGIPALSVEVGRRLSIDFSDCERFIGEGFFNFLKALAIYPGLENTREDQHLYTAKDLVTAPVSGFFQAQVELGQKVRRSDNIGLIFSIFQTTPRLIKAPADGTVIFLRREEKVRVSDILMHLVS